MTERSHILRRVFFIFLLFYIANLVVPLVGPFSYTQRMWLVTTVIVGLLSVMILLKEKLPQRSTMILGLALGILAGLVRPVTGIFTFLAFISSMRVVETLDGGIVLFRRPFLRGILFAGTIGVVLGVINLFLAGGQILEFQPSFYSLAVALNPGISEEIIFRLFIYALSLYLLGGRIKTRRETTWVYMLMILPHVLLHFPDTYFVDGVLFLDLGSMLIDPTILGLLFGLPMTLLLVKRDLTSAMIVHTVVDFIRFIFLGLPF